MNRNIDRKNFASRIVHSINFNLNLNSSTCFVETLSQNEWSLSYSTVFEFKSACFENRRKRKWRKKPMMECASHLSFVKNAILQSQQIVWILSFKFTNLKFWLNLFRIDFQKNRMSIVRKSGEIKIRKSIYKQLPCIKQKRAAVGSSLFQNYNKNSRLIAAACLALPCLAYSNLHFWRSITSTLWSF